MFKHKNDLLRLFGEARHCYAGFVGIGVVCLLSGLFRTAASMLFGQMVDIGLAGQFDALFVPSVTLLVVLVLDTLRTFVNWILTGHTFERMYLDLRVRLYHVLVRGEMPVLDKKLDAGDLIARVNSDVALLCDTTSSGFTWFMRVGIEAVVAIVGCVSLSWQLSAVYFIVLPISAYLFMKMSAPLQKQQRALSTHIGKATGIAVDALANLATNKAFTLETEMDARHAKAIDESTAQSLKSEQMVTRLTALRYLTNIIQLVTLIGMGTYLVAKGYSSAGSIIAFMALSTNVRAVVDLSDNMVSTYRRALALAKRVCEVLDMPFESGGTDHVPNPESDFAFFEHASFAYNDQHIIFPDLVIRLRNGQTVGVIGPSGAGKSTIIKLLCKFYPLRTGSLHLFGYPVEAWSHNGLRQHIALVTQDTSLFCGTIFDNVRHGRPEAGVDEVIAALKAAQLWEYIVRLPEGIHTSIGEFGDSLSGGQKQRLAIARAIVKNADLILLDEPSSALDTLSERKLQKALEHLLTNKTALMWEKHGAQAHSTFIRSQ